jgi:hypothetical protein
VYKSAGFKEIEFPEDMRGNPDNAYGIFMEKKE